MSDMDLNFRVEIKPKPVGRRRVDNDFPQGFPGEDFVCMDGFAWELIVTGDLSCTFNGGAETLAQAGADCTEAINQAKTLAREVAKP